MLTDNRSPFTHGMEIEQFPAACPRRVRTYTMSNDEGTLDGWHDDLSGPRETSIGPYKNGKTILNRWYADTRDAGITWDWHASHNDAGAGSHVHLCLAEEMFDNHIAGWTVAYNTVVELFPFFAPFFCHNWQDGFRDGTHYSGGRLNIERWADPQLTRFSTDTVRDRVESPTRYRREYSAVTFNPADDGTGKPLTIELRANDAHPAMALHGLLQVRRVTARAIEAGWSPKLENHRATLSACYDKIYHRATEVGLLTAMQEPIDGGITFKEDRGIPGIDTREFDTMFEVLKAIQRVFRVRREWRYRPQQLVSAGRDDYSPHRNPDALWHIDAPRAEFEWAHGPETRAPLNTDPTDDAAGADATAVAADGGNEEGA